MNIIFNVKVLSVFIKVVQGAHETKHAGNDWETRQPKIPSKIGD